MTKTQYSPKLKAQAVEFYAKGIEMNLICSSIGCSPSAVTKWAKAAGLKPRMSWRQQNAIEQRKK